MSLSTSEPPFPSPICKLSSPALQHFALPLTWLPGPPVWKDQQPLPLPTLQALHQLVEEKLKYLQDLTHEIWQDVGFSGFWDWLTSWLPDFSWRKQIFAYGVFVIVGLILLCCCIQCVPSLIGLVQKLRPSGHSAAFTLCRDKVQQIREHLLNWK